MEMPENKIEVRDLNFYYSDDKVLSDISIDIQDRQITALIGPSGCGKSTFLRCLNRMNDTIPGTRVEGQILLDGMDIYDPQVDVVDLRHRVGMVFQRPNPFPQSIYDNVAFGPRVMGLNRRSHLDDVVEESLRGAALWDIAKDDLGQDALGLSLGEQQRLCIARTIAVKPEVILMDEPCSALDPAGTEAVEELIWKLRGEYTILIVTHNMAQARRASEECAFMLNGRLVEHRPTTELFLTPQHQETADYIEGRYG